MVVTDGKSIEIVNEDHIETRCLKMKNKLLLTLPSIPCLTNAAGFQLNAQSATGLGRAFAGLMR